ncbi:ABC transporter ATP-binding protein/permease [Idiomarina xiamenensis]|uniref:ABC transporter, transmembrane region, type 1 n=1 Tax=Idiomarina xiamenensis 10-D-4 TaxID=740709 RepID=K2JVV8_9GAMM|nr:ATP-binding cassette domain-containing protein [Idiomarina xiamenensis]EKE87541.1 ABC transporter, transmembrane region, type 1 [Idiomarina xiamenensis 10-D-4]
MRSGFNAASAYLKQLAKTVKRPIQRAFLFGLVKTLAIIVQLWAVARLAHDTFVGEQALLQQYPTLISLGLASLLRVYAGWQREQAQQRAASDALQAARQQLTERWQQQLQQGQRLAAADGSLALEPIDALHGYFSRYLVLQYLTVFSPLLILSVCFWLNPVVGLLLLISGPVIPLFMALIGIGAERLSQQHAQQNFALSRSFTDKLRNLATLQLFAATDTAVDDVAAAGERYRQATMSTLKVAFLSSAVLEFFASVAIAGVALYVGFGLLGYISWLGADQLTLFSGLLVLLLAPEYFAPLRQFAQSYHDRAAALGAATLLCEHQPKQTLSPVTTAASSEHIAWQRLSVTLTPNMQLHYPPAQWRCNTLVVISGPSGSGKTTLLRALLGQAPYTGELSMPAPMSATTGRAYFAQQPYIKPGSIRANLNLFGQYHDQQLQQALAAVALTPLLAQLADGLDTHIGERGVGLSGGERRRLALARCLLAQRPLLIADEPTENLDPASAAVIRQQLRELTDKGCTVVVASHDPELQRMADHHYVIGCKEQDHA